MYFKHNYWKLNCRLFLELWLFILKSNDREIELDLNCTWAGPAFERSLISSWKVSYDSPPPQRTDAYANVCWEIKKNCGAWNWLISAFCVSARVKLESPAPISKTLQNILYPNKRHSASGLFCWFMINWWKGRGVILPAWKMLLKTAHTHNISNLDHLEGRREGGAMWAAFAKHLNKPRHTRRNQCQHGKHNPRLLTGWLSRGQSGTQHLLKGATWLLRGVWLSRPHKAAQVRRRPHRNGIRSVLLTNAPALCWNCWFNCGLWLH